MKGRIKKAVVRKPRAKKPETMQDLKDATDKYFAIREVAFDLHEHWGFITKVRNILVKDQAINAHVEEFAQWVFGQWSEPIKTEAAYINQIREAGVSIDEAFVGLARLKFEAQKGASNA